MGLIGLLSARAKPRAFPVIGWRGEAAWNGLRRSGRIVATAAPHDADLLFCLGELPEGWRDSLLRLYETLPLPRLPVHCGDGAPGAAASLPGVLHLRPAEADDEGCWAAIRDARLDLDRANNRRSLEDRPPVPWRGIGPHGQGGEGMMGGKPYGRPMAMTAEDPDQLALDDVATALGPFFPGLPGGLRLDLQVQGDRVRSVTRVANLFPPRPAGPDEVEPALAPFVAARAGQTVTLGAMERARIGAHLSWAADLLMLCGLESLGQACAQAAAQPPGEASVRRLFERAERCGLRQLLQGVGSVEKAVAERLHLLGPVARASGVRRDSRLEDPAYAAAGFTCLTESDGDCWARWRLRRRECLQSFALIERAGERAAGCAEAPGGELRRRGEGRLAGASAANMAVLESGVAGREWFEAVLFIASLGLDMREAALR